MDDDFRVNILISGAELREDRDTAIARMLREVADRVEHGYESGIVKDINGNTVGDWEFD